jgi:hypothetical protein
MDEKEVFLKLLHIHDHIWFDKNFSLVTRIESCQIIRLLIIKQHLEYSRKLTDKEISDGVIRALQSGSGCDRND